jgi:hypothetical protein
VVDVKPERAQSPLVRWAVVVSAASIVLPALAFVGNAALRDVPVPDALIRTALALAACAGGLLACLGLVLTFTALARWPGERPAPMVRLVTAILCCLAALPVNACLLVASQYVQ